jgi:zinc protease
MLSKTHALVIIFLLLHCLAFPAYAEVKEIESHGIHAYAVEENSLPIVTIDITFRNSGYAYDPENKQGLASVAAALLTEGAGGYDRRAFKEALENNGVELTASASADSFSVSLKTLKAHQAEAVKLLLLAITSPRFEQGLLDITRKQMQLSLTKERENADDIAHRAWMTAMFGTHPYSRHAYGTEKTLETITPKDLKQFSATRFNANNLIVSVVGNITSSEVKSLLNTLHGQLHTTSGAVTPLPEWRYEQQDKTLFIAHAPSAQNTIYFGLPWTTYDDPDFYPAYVLNFILGGGSFESRLTKEIREKSGLTYSIGTDVLSFDKQTVLVGQASTRKGQENTVIERVNDILKDLHTLGVTDEELQLAKRYLAGSFPLRLDTSDKIAGYLTFIQFRSLGTDFIERRNALIEKVTIEDIRRIAGKWLQPKQVFFVTAGERLEPPVKKQ